MAGRMSHNRLAAFQVLPPPDRAASSVGCLSAKLCLPWCAQLAFVLENPVNALWPLLLAAHSYAHRFFTYTTSYCKRPAWGCDYRKSTRFLCSLHPSRPLPSECRPNDPCRFLQQCGSHPRRIGGP